MRSETVFLAHRVVPERFALCALGAKGVRAVHPVNTQLTETIDRVLTLIAERKTFTVESPTANADSALPVTVTEH